MRILLLCHSFNSLSQRLFVELGACGHDVSVEFDISDAVTAEAVQLFQPDLIVAPFLKRAIPAIIWRHHTCLIVHPGPVGDRGPAALDWAVLDGEPHWGVTVLQATAEMDAGPVWAHRRFAMRQATKSSLYRNDVTEAAVSAVLEAVKAFGRGTVAPRPAAQVAGAMPCWRPAMRQADRAIDWRKDNTQTIMRKIASADGMPGLKDELFGRPAYLFDAHAADDLHGSEPGAVIARSGSALARATADGAVWIGHARLANARHAIKLPATELFAHEAAGLPERSGYRDIWYEEDDRVGYLHFPFYNGAMGTAACRRLLAAYKEAISRPTDVIVLMGGSEFWSNGLDLNRIEAADSAADESWRNINAINDLSEAIIKTTSHLVISALCGNAGAGGVFLARAADEVWLRDGVILNPHYKDMGNLYGSELWTYLLPRYAGQDNATRIAQARLPMAGREALSLGLADKVLSASRAVFLDDIHGRARKLAGSPSLGRRLRDKADRRAGDEAVRPLSDYRADELEHMHRNFYGFDPSYHVARYNFVHKVAKSRTPITIARHRDGAYLAAISRKAAS